MEPTSSGSPCSCSAGSWTGGTRLGPCEPWEAPRLGGPEVLDAVDLPDPTPGQGRQLFDVSTAGVNYTDTHHSLS